MSRYIDADLLKNRISEHKRIAIHKDDIARIISDIPTADVEEVRHGQWLVNSDEHMDIGFICSSCGKDQDDISGFLYCPNCGAKMDLQGVINNERNRKPK